MLKGREKYNNCNAEIVERTTNSTRLYIQKSTKRGINCYQWFTNKKLGELWYEA